ncbi:MAG: hypothetical protein AB7K04_15965 [Pseudorhodoplanes sp.]
MSVFASHPMETVSRRPALTGAFTLAVVLVAALLLRFLVGTNMDVSWLLTVGEKVLDGQRLYVDLIEVNPPASVFLYLPAVWMQRITGLRAEIIVDGLMFLGIAGSMLAAGLILQSARLLEGLDRWTLASLMLAVLAILPVRTFGEREHIAILTILPFLALAALRAGNRPVRRSAILIAGIGAGLTIVIKPHFAIPVALVILAAAWNARRVTPLFAPENWIAAALAIAYGVFVVLAYPDFIRDVMPMVQMIYLPMHTAAWRVVLSAPVFCSLALFVMLWRRDRERMFTPPVAQVWAACAGFCAVYFVQMKGWPYHAYPMTALAFVPAAFMLSRFREAGDARSAHAPQSSRGLATLLPMAVIFLTGMVYFNVAENTNRLIAPIRAISTHPKMLIITSDLSVGHPLTRQAGGTWVSRVPSTWITAGVISRRGAGPLDPQTAARLDAYEQRDRDMLAEDIRRNKPDVIVTERELFDWDAWARAQPAVAEELKAYRVAAEIGYFRILQRTD